MRLTRCLPFSTPPQKKAKWTDVGPDPPVEITLLPSRPMPKSPISSHHSSHSLCQSQRLVQRRDHKTTTFSLLTFHTYTYGELPVLPRKFELRIQIEEEEEE